MLNINIGILILIFSFQSIIYPQNKDGEPEYNPCGKYMVKLHLNGVPRKVNISFFFPVPTSISSFFTFSPLNLEESKLKEKLTV